MQKPNTIGPYEDEGTNVIYQLLFCDQPAMFEKHYTGPLAPPWSTLFSKEPDLNALNQIAEDKQQESRVRALAFNLLRAAGRSVTTKEYLGTIIEVRLEEGLDTLAVFADGGARYINYSGRVAVVEGKPSPFDDEIKGVIDSSKPIVAAIGPWEEERLPPPKVENIPDDISYVRRIVFWRRTDGRDANGRFGRSIDFCGNKFARKNCEHEHLK